MTLLERIEKYVRLQGNQVGSGVELSEILKDLADPNQRFHFEVYSELPETGEGNVLYLIGPTGSGDDKYEEYVYYDGSFTKIGDTTLDLSGYSTTEQMNAAISAAVTAALGIVASTYATKSEVNEKEATINAELAKKANTDGYYGGMTVGSAERLEAPSNVVDDSIEQITGGVAEIANGYAKINEAKGRSQVWNQLVKNGNFADSSFWGKNSGATLSIENNIAVLTAENPTTFFISQSNIKVSSGHRMFYHIEVFAENSCTLRFGYNNASSVVGTINRPVTGGIWNTITGIATAGANGMTDLMIYITSNENSSIKFRNIYLNDLTLLGIDNLTTPEQVEAWLAENKGLKPYYPYDAGSILNAKLIGLESYGRNLLNPSTNKARIIGRYSDTYGNYYGITGTYDSISFTSDLGETTAITPDSDGKFVLTTPGIIDVVNPGADCAVFIWWDGKKTDFTPYKTSKAYIDFTHIYGKLNGTGELVQVFPDGGRGINDVKDRLYVENGKVIAKLTNGKVDLGSLTWSYNSDHFYTTGITDARRQPTFSSRLTEQINTKGYQSVANIGSSDDGSIEINAAAHAQNLVFIKDTAYSDAATFKTEMAGVPLVYELATPLIYTDLVYQGSDYYEDGTPVTLPVDYEVDNYGMEVQLFESDSVPAELSIRYQMDAAEAIDTLQTEMAEVKEAIEPANLISAASMDNLLAMLGPVLNGTLSKTWNSTTGAYEFTFTPNE